MDSGDLTPLLMLVAAGLVGGLVLFARGLVAYRRDRLISSVATSTIDGLAAGEVRVSGVVEAIDQTLISPLQSRPCVWYRARVETTGKNSHVLMSEEQSQEFRVRDATGALRVVPRGARWEIDAVFDEQTGMMGDEPPGLQRRSGAAWAMALERDPATMTETEREVARQALLTVQQPAAPIAGHDWEAGGGSFLGNTMTSSGRRYREARLEPGQIVTVLGQAWPWSEVRDSVLAWDPGDNVERGIADDLATAREAGLLLSPEAAWGNAAIPGFGIGAPESMPELDPRATKPRVPETPVHDPALARYDIPDEELVLSRGQRGLAVYLGPPTEATQHHDPAFLLGLVGAVMAALSAFAMGAIVTGTL